MFRRLAWPTIIYMAVIHLGALAAPFYFTWPAFFVFLFLSWLTGCLGITMGYHRLLTHNSFETKPWFRRFLATVGCLASQGPPIQWVADHRQHHQFSDSPGDPHSPVHGFWWSHMGWSLVKNDPSEIEQRQSHYAPDLLREKYMRALTPLFMPLIIALGVLLYALGGLPWLVWGLFFRMVFNLHITWCINSVCHVFGYQNYRTHDDSHNCWWLALPSFGESWHNNHHAEPSAANHGHHPAEVDHTYWMIRQLEKIGLAWKIKVHTP